MNPNEYQPQQPIEPQIPPQPTPPPQTVVGGESLQQPFVQPGPQPQQPQMAGGSYGPQYSQQPMQQPMTSGEVTGNKSSIFGHKLWLVVIIVIILLVGAFILSKVMHSNSSKTGTSLSSTTGTSSTSGSATTTSKTCDQLFTTSDATTTMGSTAQASPVVTQNKNNVKTTTCIYSANNDSLTVSISAATSSSGDSEISSLWSQIASAGFPAVSGVGDKAYYNSSPSYNALAVLNGEVVISISENNGSQAKDTQTVNTILGRL